MSCSTTSGTHNPPQNGPMNTSIFHNKDFWAGIFLVAIGAAAVFIARNYTFGTALGMGPGYFPTVLGALLTLFGIYLVASGLKSGEAIGGRGALRGRIVLTLSLVLFGRLMRRSG